MVLTGLAQAQLMHGDLAAALDTVEQRLRYEPKNAAALDLRGDVLVRMGKIDEAQQSWFKAAGATHGSTLLTTNLLRANKDFAQAALRGGDLPRAERLLRRAIALSPRDAQLCQQLADVLEKAGQAPAAGRWRAYAESLR
jgi:Flp pilus assembly protein TadD